MYVLEFWHPAMAVHFNIISSLFRLDLQVGGKCRVCPSLQASLADPGVDPHGAKEPAFGLDLVLRSIDDRLNWNHPLWLKN